MFIRSKMQGLVATALLATTSVFAMNAEAATKVEHVLLISVDGLHAGDLAAYTKAHPTSALAALSNSGVTYAQAYTPFPSDSFPGIIALISGASPKSSGVYYDDSYDRALSEAGSDCSKKGTEAVYDESIDANPDKLDGGGSIDAAKLPRDPANNCQPVYPHQFTRVNNVFEVVKAAGGTTAWSDKHLSYDLVQGPSGKGVDDLYTPEIESNIEDKSDGITSSIDATEKYDDLKVQATINQIKGLDHTGANKAAVPTVFGFNFQEVSVTQKLEGYADASGKPSAGLQGALDHTDASLQQIVDALKAANLSDNTAIIVTAKHGQSPIDPTKRRIIDKKLIPGLVEGLEKGLLAKATADDVTLLWLTDAAKTGAVVKMLEQNRDKAGIAKIISGAALTKMFADPKKDSRAPDIVIESQHGVIYTKPSATKKAEHGGFADDDRHVALLVVAPGHKHQTVASKVATQQVAPSILKLLGEPTSGLQAVKAEHTAALPAL